MTLTVALTGGIGSGKSTVAERFAARGVPVIDADRLARELVAPGQPALDAISAAFGTKVLNGAGELDRRTLRGLIFHDPGLRERLEAILHPRIRAEMLRRVAASEAPYVLLVVPLLVETGQTDLADRILVVDLPEAQQIERTCRRDEQAATQVEAILRAQCERRRRLSLADDVIDNRGAPEALDQQVENLHRRYMSLACNKKN